MYLEQAALYSLLRCDLIFTSAPAAVLQHSRPTWWAEQNTLYFIGTFSSCIDLYNPAYGTYWEWQTHIHIQDGGWIGGGGRCVYWRQQLRSISLFLVSLHLSLRRRCNHYGMPRNLRSHDWDKPLFSCPNPHFRRTIQNYILNEFSFTCLLFVQCEPNFPVSPKPNRVKWVWTADNRRSQQQMSVQHNKSGAKLLKMHFFLTNSVTATGGTEVTFSVLF